MNPAPAPSALAAPNITPSAPRALVGLDGFVDTIVEAVDVRNGRGDEFRPIATLGDLGRRITAAAGQSTNIELYPRLDKIGGNGPIMAGALLATGVDITCVGALGLPEIHPVFADLASRGRVYPLCAPARTTALEFGDGKLMLGMMRSLDEITFDLIAERMGSEVMCNELAAASLVALVNWTMIPNMTSVLQRLAEEVLPVLPPRNPRRIFFFDLADPEKRPPADLSEVLGVISKWESFGRVVLGLNFKEALQVAKVLAVRPAGESAGELRSLAETIRARLDVDTVVVHPRRSAACATREGSWWVAGTYIERPLITTGAGDHFNAGFTRGMLLELPPKGCLTLGVCTSGHYVRTGVSPSLAQLGSSLAQWSD